MAVGVMMQGGIDKAIDDGLLLYQGWRRRRWHDPTLVGQLL